MLENTLKAKFARRAASSHVRRFTGRAMILVGISVLLAEMAFVVNAVSAVLDQYGAPVFGQITALGVALPYFFRQCIRSDTPSWPLFQHLLVLFWPSTAILAGNLLLDSAAHERSGEQP